MFNIWKKEKKEGFDYGLLNTDMHSHLIPGIDDGSPDLDTSIQLIKGLADLGYKKLITTPHIMWDMYKNSSEDILSRYTYLQDRINKENIDVEIKIAAEYFLDDHFKMLLANKEPLLAIKDNLVLVEFSLANEPIDLKEILFEMQLLGYQPVIAHPERYSYNERNTRFFSDMKISGYLFQLNILSLAGAYGKSAKALAQYFIKNSFYEFAGSDLHNLRHLKMLNDPAINTELNRLLDSGNLRNLDL
jgi:protein-tyrosine phosphatase